MNQSKIRALLLNLMIIIDEIMSRNNVEYYTIAGTLLGLRRYGGFIPWDDDIDIAIFREDYDRLITLFEKELPTGIKIVTLENDDKYCQEYPKVCYMNKKGVYSEISIDIFILDKTLEKDYLVRYFQDKVKKIIYISKYYQANNSDGKRYEPKSKMKQILLKTTSKIKRNRLNSFLTYSMMLRNRRETSYRINWGSCFDYRTQVMKESVFSPAKKEKFEGIIVSVPHDIDSFLRSNYGADFMTPPPVKDRVNHNVSLVGCEDVDFEDIEKRIADAKKKAEQE